jgi:hypothetical protein
MSVETPRLSGTPFMRYPAGIPRCKRRWPGKWKRPIVAAPGVKPALRIPVFALLWATVPAGSAAEIAPGLGLSGYLEAYVSGDPARPPDNTRQGPFFNFSRVNEVAVNLALVEVTLDRPNARGRVGLMAGTYPQANLAAEPPALRNLYEASVGVKLGDTHDVWLDAGVMPSHIGFESAIGADNWTLTRSISAENSPYYMAGARLGWTRGDRQWSAAAVVLNGWQRMARPDGVTLPSWGTQVTWTPVTRVTVNWSTFSGYERPGQLRTFSNLYAQVPLGERWDLTAGFDMGRESRAQGDGHNHWSTVTLVTRVRLDERSALGARVERYADPEGVVVTIGGKPGFVARGVSLNYDRRLRDDLLWRVELRHVGSRDPVFADADGSPSRRNVFLTTSLSIRF